MTVRHPEKINNRVHPIPKKPSWIRVKAPISKAFSTTKSIIKNNKLTTVCEEAACPNIGECWEKKHATFMILGDTCTRGCSFCNVKTGKPQKVDKFEPYNIANTIKELALEHVVITSVDRDDLNDGGAQHFANVIECIRKECKNITIEILTPDFLRKESAKKIIVKSKPDVFNHNLETVPRLYPSIRPGARYFISLELLKDIKKLYQKIHYLNQLEKKYNKIIENLNVSSLNKIVPNELLLNIFESDIGTINYVIDEKDIHISKLLKINIKEQSEKNINKISLNNEIRSSLYNELLKETKISTNDQLLTAILNNL